MRFRITPPLRVLAPLVAFAALCACAPSRTIVTGPEADVAERFFAGLPGRVVFPVKASFSGTAVPVAGDAVPFVAGISAPTPEEETVGLYDPLGHGVAFLSNDGRRMAISRGPAADLAGFRGAAPVDAGPVSLARILSGAPGYEVTSARGGAIRRRRLVAFRQPSDTAFRPGSAVSRRRRVPGPRDARDGRLSRTGVDGSAGADRPVGPWSEVHVAERSGMMRTSRRSIVLPALILLAVLAACGGGKTETWTGNTAASRTSRRTAT